MLLQSAGFRKALGIAQWSRLVIARAWSYTKLQVGLPIVILETFQDFPCQEFSSSAEPDLHRQVYELDDVSQRNRSDEFEWLY